MTKEIKNLETLKENAITITHPIKVRFPQFNKEEILSIDCSTLVNNTYETNNGTVAFVSDGTLYVIPYMKQVMDILLENGFTCKNRYVPFSKCDYPVAWESKWNELKRLAKACA